MTHGKFDKRLVYPKTITVIHKLDLNLASSLAYFLMLYAKSLGQEIDVGKLDEALKKLDVATSNLDTATKE